MKSKARETLLQFRATYLAQGSREKQITRKGKRSDESQRAADHSNRNFRIPSRRPICALHLINRETIFEPVVQFYFYRRSVRSKRDSLT